MQTIAVRVSDVYQLLPTDIPVPAGQVILDCSEDRPVTDPDARLRADLKLALRNAGYTALRMVKIEMRAGTVVLRGRVSSYYLKQLAQTVALRAANGQRGIANHVEVVRPRLEGGDV